MEVSTSPTSSLRSQLRLLYHLALRPVRGESHAERLESFYGPQADLYDQSRNKLLVARAPMIRSVLERCPGGTWLDLGCGTGANFSVDPQGTRKFEKVIGVDLSDSLLTVAKRRVKHEQLGNIELVKHDATTYRPETQGINLITFSYALSMIPNWFAALEHAFKLLAPGGLIGVSDFYVSRRFPAPGLTQHSWLTRTFWPAWFGADNVSLSQDLLPYLLHQLAPQKIEEGRGSVPFLPFAKVPYFVFVGRKI